MKNLYHIIHKGLFAAIGAFLVSVASLSLYSCSEDSETGAGALDTPQLPIDENKVTVSISIPRSTFGNNNNATRADENDPLVKKDPLVGDEGIIRNLYLVAFKQNVEEAYDEGTIVLSYPIQNNDQGAPENEDKSFNRQIQLDVNSTYKFYAFANIENYWIDEVNGNTKDNFTKLITDFNLAKDLELNFKENNSADERPMVISADELPMVFLADEMTITKGEEEVVTQTNATELYLSKNDKNVKIEFKLSILCSKVRYTVLFDRTETGFSRSFTEDDVDFVNTDQEESNTDPEESNRVVTNENVEFINVSNKTPLLPYTSSHDPSFFESSLTNDISQVNYPLGDKIAYLDIENVSNFTKSPDMLDLLVEPDNWDSASKRAWQGSVVYLPENTYLTSGPSTDPDSQFTTLHLSAVGTGVKEEGYDIKIPDMTRGHFYDIVAKMQSSTDIKVEIYVSVNPWTYNPQPEEW